MALIEADISRHIEEVLLGLGGVDSEVFVTDGSGQLWASVTPEDGVRIATPGQVIKGLPPDFEKQMAEPKKPFEIKQEYEYLGKRFYVDPSGRGVVIFARLPSQ